MLPETLEYSFLLSLAFLSAWALLFEQMRGLFHDAQFWVGAAIFVFGCFLVDLFAVHQRWWVFEPGKSLGFQVAEIPIEEFALFIIVYCWVLAVWRTLDRGPP